jgi:hypothetical protein
MILYKNIEIRQNLYDGSFYYFKGKNIVKTQTLAEMKRIIDAELKT